MQIEQRQAMHLRLLFSGDAIYDSLLLHVTLLLGRKKSLFATEGIARTPVIKSSGYRPTDLLGRQLGKKRNPL